MTIEEKRRELFEAKMAIVLMSEGYQASSATNILARSDDGEYQSIRMWGAWTGFNAALDAVEIRLPRDGVEFDEVGMMRNITISKCRAAIESTGLGLKVLP